MSYVYINFDISVHHLSIPDKKGIEEYRQRIYELIRENHPAGNNIYDSDVEVSIIEYARHDD